MPILDQEEKQLSQGQAEADPRHTEEQEPISGAERQELVSELPAVQEQSEVGL